jgi:hypothetical protein
MDVGLVSSVYTTQAVMYSALRAHRMLYTLQKSL